MFTIRNQSSGVEVYLKMVGGNPCLMISNDGGEGQCICWLNNKGQLELESDLEEYNEYGLDVIDGYIVVKY